jgi:hypothetical protein
MTSPGESDGQMTSLAWPGHDPANRACTDYVVAADIGELAPRHRLLVRGVCLYGDRLWLYFAWTAGLTEPMGEDSGVWLNAEYGADVMSEDFVSAGSYSTGGGEFSEGEIGYARPPASARRVWFDFYATTNDDHRACQVTIDLATGRVRVDR